MNLLLKTHHVTPIAGRGCLGEKLRHAVKMPEAEGLSPESNMGMLSCYLIGNCHRTSTPTNKALLRGHQTPPEAILLGLLTIVVAVALTILGDFLAVLMAILWIFFDIPLRIM